MRPRVVSLKTIVMSGILSEPVKMLVPEDQIGASVKTLRAVHF